MDTQTIKTYDKMAKEYDDETADFWQRFPRTFFDKFIFLTKDSVLDVGSGPGRDGLIIKEKGLDVVCLDASAEMVKLSAEKGLKSVVGDFNNLPFEDQTFGGVWAYTSLLHIPKSDIGKPLAEIRRVLKKEGILGLGMIEGKTEGYRQSAGVNLPRYFAFYEKAEIEKLLTKHGFKVVYFEQFKPGSKNYLNFIAQKIN